ncbi:unnamed protein product [Urochloa humidicola]
MDTWVVDMEKLDGGVESPETAEKWLKHCIFRVPPHFKVIHGDVFTPEVVAIGPFHHWNLALRPMEEHKRRAVRHLLRRAAGTTTAAALSAAVEAVAGELEDAYAGLGAEWRGVNKSRFLEMMVTDGCFLLEVMWRRFNDYAPGDPVFSRHAAANIAAFVQRDMLMVENQLPLLVLHRIASVVVVPAPSEDSINMEVLKFLGIYHPGAAAGQLGLHPLDIYRRGHLGGVHRRVHLTPLNKNRDDELNALPPRSAQKLREAGIQFRLNGTDLLDDVEFDEGKRWLSMPRVLLDDTTEHKYRNMMAFEALHSSTGNDVTAFLLFLRDMVDSVDDVAWLRRPAGVLRHHLGGGDGAAMALLHGLTKDVAMIGESRLGDIREHLELYCRASWRALFSKSWTKLRKRTFALISWGTIIFITTDVMQTAYAVMSYDLTKHSHG